MITQEQKLFKKMDRQFYKILLMFFDNPKMWPVDLQSISAALSDRALKVLYKEKML